MHSFQQDIRKTLTQYALIPVLAIALLGTLLGLWSWQHDVAERSVQVSATAADVLNSLLKDYSNRLDYVVENEDFYNLQQDSEHRRAVYEWLYHEVNITHDNTMFYLLDPQGRVLLSNRKNLPAYLEDTPMNWGIWQRLRKQPDKALAEFSPRMDNKNSDLLLGRAVLRQGELKGYWIFVIRGEYIVNAINSPYMDFALLTYSPRLKPGDSGILANLACRNGRSYEFSPQWTMPCPYIFMQRRFFVLHVLYLWQHFYPVHVCCRNLDKSIP